MSVIYSKARKVLAFICQDRHDALSYTAVGLLAAGVSVEFGLGWAMIVVGAVLTALAGKGGWLR